MQKPKCARARTSASKRGTSTRASPVPGGWLPFTGCQRTQSPLRTCPLAAPHLALRPTPLSAGRSSFGSLSARWIHVGKGRHRTPRTTLSAPPSTCVGPASPQRSRSACPGGREVGGKPKAQVLRGAHLRLRSALPPPGPACPRGPTGPSRLVCSAAGLWAGKAPRAPRRAASGAVSSGEAAPRASVCRRPRFGGGLGATSALRGTDPVTPGWAGVLRESGVPKAPVDPSPTSLPQRRRFLEPRGPREGADGDTSGGPWGGLLAADARVRPGSLSLRERLGIHGCLFHFQSVGDGTVSTVTVLYIQPASKGRINQALNTQSKCRLGSMAVTCERTALEGWRQDQNKTKSALRTAAASSCRPGRFRKLCFSPGAGLLAPPRSPLRRSEFTEL